MKTGLNFFSLAAALCCSLIFAWPLYGQYLPPPAAGPRAFIRDLKLGDRGQDIYRLQRLLNSQPFSRLASFGPGSPGMETDFFGPLTRAAVIKFQEYYGNEILRPLNLNRGTGFVGRVTRAKLNQLTGQSPAEAAIEPSSILPNQPPASLSALPPPLSTVPTDAAGVQPPAASAGFLNLLPPSEELRAMFLAEYAAPPGGSVTIFGSGFPASDNTVYFSNGQKIERLAASAGGTALSFNLPENFPPGRYQLWVGNSRGLTGRLDFLATDPSLPKPTITSIEPSRAAAGAELRISGSGFERSAFNRLRFGADAVEGLSSPDGLILVVRLPANVFGDFDQEPDEDSGGLNSPAPEGGSFDLPVTIFAENRGGISNGFLFHLIYEY